MRLLIEIGVEIILTWVENHLQKPGHDYWLVLAKRVRAKLELPWSQQQR